MSERDWSRPINFLGEYLRHKPTCQITVAIEQAAGEGNPQCTCGLERSQREWEIVLRWPKVGEET